MTHESEAERAISEALLILEKSSMPENSALIVASGDLVGNQGGYAGLAMASLKAALGQAQNLKNESWFYVEDLDYSLDQLSPDPSAHLRLPSREQKRKRKLSNLIAFPIFVVFAICALVGFIVLCRIILTLLFHW